MVPTIYIPCRLEAEDAARCGLMVCDQGEWLYLAPDLRLTKILPTTRTKEGVCSLTLYQVSTQLSKISTISIYTVYLQYLYSVSTIFIQFIYTLHCNEIFFQKLYIFVQWHRPDLSKGLAHCALIQ